ncbi:hypothetical protein [Streptomyces mirabilis]
MDDGFLAKITSWPALMGGQERATGLTVFRIFEGDLCVVEVLQSETVEVDLHVKLLLLDQLSHHCGSPEPGFLFDISCLQDECLIFLVQSPFAHGEPEAATAGPDRDGPCPPLP